MQHVKTYHCKEVHHPNGTLTIHGPVRNDTLQQYTMHETLRAFRTPDEQYDAILSIAELAESRVIVAVRENTIVGYALFLHPDPLEPWSDENMPDLLVIGAIEVATPFRHGGIAKHLLEVAFMDDAMEDYIVMSAELYWHWDLKGTGLDAMEYKNVMEKVMGHVGLRTEATDDPEICSHPANCLMVRFGKRVGQDRVEVFDRMRFRRRMIY